MSCWLSRLNFSPFLFVVGVVLLATTVSTVATSQTPRTWKGGGTALSGTPENTGFQAARDALKTASHPIANHPVVGAAGNMIGFSNQDDSGTQAITLVDTSKSWMAVYHIDRSGEIRLVSSRPLEADFSLQLNVTAPYPDNIRQLGNR